MAQKEYGRWENLEHYLYSYQILSFQSQIFSLQGWPVLLAYRTWLEAGNGSLAILLPGQGVGHPLWGRWLTNPIHPENIQKYTWVEGPKVIPYGQESLQALLILEEERPSQIEDVYLLRYLGGNTALGSAFLRVGGYFSPSFSAYGSYSWDHSKRSKGRGEEADNPYQWDLLSLAWSYEASDDLEIFGFLKSQIGSYGLENSFEFLGGKYRRREVLPKMGVRWKPSSAIHFQWMGSYQYEEEKLTSPRGLYASIYQDLPSQRAQRFFSVIKGEIHGKDSLLFGEKTEWGGKIQVVGLKSWSIGKKQHKGLRFFTYIEQRRRLFSFLDGYLVLGLGKGPFHSLRYSLGTSFTLKWQKHHQIHLFAYGHYYHLPLYFYIGRFLDQGGSLFWAGSSSVRLPKIHNFEVNYTYGSKSFYGKMALFYQEIFPVSPERKGAILSPKNEGRQKWGGFAFQGEWQMSKQWKLGCRVSKTYPLETLAFPHFPPPLKGALYLAFKASSESFFRGWQGKILFYYEDSFKNRNWLTQEVLASPKIFDLDIQLSYGYHGFGKRLEFLLGCRNLFNGDRRKMGSTPFGSGKKGELHRERIFWFGFRLSL